MIEKALLVMISAIITHFWTAEAIRRRRASGVESEKKQAYEIGYRKGRADMAEGVLSYLSSTRKKPRPKC